MKRVPIGTIKNNPNNPRVIKDDKFKKLVQSIKDLPEMAEVRPVVVNTDMVVLGGNMRLKAMREAGWKDVPIHVVDWDEDKQRQFIIKDNVSGGEWDWEMLANQWDTEELQEWGLDLPDFDNAKELEAEEDDYEMPEEVQTDIVLGDLFEIGPHRLLCGDSTDSDAVAKLMDGQKADIAFTSPPYNAGKNVRGNFYENDNDDKSKPVNVNFGNALGEWENEFNDDEWIDEMIIAGAKSYRYITNKGKIQIRMKGMVMKYKLIFIIIL